MPNYPSPSDYGFSLAAYNAGVWTCARRETPWQKIWATILTDGFDHTENAMLLLSKKKYAKKARYGFVNGKEPVNYVRQIKQRFEAYVDLNGTLLGSRPGLRSSMILAGR